MLFELKVAFRFLKSGKAQTFFILFGIALGVAVQIFLGALITSLQGNLVDSTIGNQGHIVIKAETDYWSQYFEEDNNTTIVRGNYASSINQLDNFQWLIEDIREDENVKLVTPLLNGNGIISNLGKSQSVFINGIDPEGGNLLYELSGRIDTGVYDLTGNNVLIGSSLGEELGYEIGDQISIRNGKGIISQYIISGLFDLENENINNTWVVMSIDRAQRFTNSAGKVSALAIQLFNPFDSVEINQVFKQKYTDYSIVEWQSENQQLLSALASQGSSSYTIQFFVIVAITFGIASVLAVSVIQKSKEIGILKAMGVTKGSASRIFIYQGFFLGFIGAIIGTVFGLLLIKMFSTYSPLGFEITVKAGALALIMVVATFAGVISSLIPARRSANLSPMEAINNG